jgi:hypothetical protein
MFGLEFTLMANEGLLGMVLAQTMCQTFMLVMYMAPGTVYGGIPNGENQGCPLFFIEMDSKGMRVDDDEGRRLNDDNNYFNMEHSSNITSTMG